MRACAWSRFPSWCAGTARSPTSDATCPSHPDCSQDPPAPYQGPGVALGPWSRLPPPRTDGSLVRAWLPIQCPRADPAGPSVLSTPPYVRVESLVTLASAPTTVQFHTPPPPGARPRPGDRRACRPRPARCDQAVPERQDRPPRRGPCHPRGRLRVPRRSIRRRQVDAHPVA